MTTTTSSSNTQPTTLVVGATGATGRHVVQMLLNNGYNVRVIARSKERMLSLLLDSEAHYGDRLHITEASILNMSNEELEHHVDGCEAVVSCLGHNITFQGMWGKASRGLVTKVTKRLTNAIRKKNKNNKTKFILMGTDGVAHPDGTTDDRRSLMERSIVFLLRYLVPPHADNEQAAAYLYNETSREDVSWSIVRPTDLINGDVSEYAVYEKPQGSLFGSGATTRANVADFMVQLIADDKKWDQYKHKMPVVINTSKLEKK